MKKIFTLLNYEQKIHAVFILFLMIIGMLIETLGIGLILPLIAIMVETDVVEKYPIVLPIIEYLNYPDQALLILYVIGFIVIVYLLKNFYLYFLLRQQSFFAYGIQKNISQTLFNKYLKQPYIYFLNINSANLVRNIITEVVMFTSVIIAANLFVAEILVTVGICTLMIVYEPIGAISVILIFSVVGTLFYIFFKGKLKRWGISRQINEGLKIKHLNHGFGGIKDIKLYNKENFFINEFSKKNKIVADISALMEIQRGIPRLLFEILAVIGLFILILVITYQEKNLVTYISTIGLFAGAAFRLMPSMNRIVGSIQSLRYARPVVDILYNDLKSLHILEKYSKENIPKLRNKIELKNLSHSYEKDGGTKILNDINLEILHGTKIGIIGKSGSGKSTLANLILGLIKPTQGKILVDGNDISLSIYDWTNQIGYVPQNIYILDETLKKNIAFGINDIDISEDNIHDSINKSQLKDFVNSLQNGIDTILGERGVRISGGQLQRIGIARALYHNPSVLVLDEATSSLDNETEKDFMDVINDLDGSRTMIIISHRLSTLEKCDKIYEINDGDIREVKNAFIK